MTRQVITVDPETSIVETGSSDRVIDGAGVAVDGHAGLIVTCAHVIERSYDISVTLSDGRQFKAFRVDADSNSDVAVIRIAGADLVAIPMANSNTLEVGDYLIAIGNPFGMGITVTQGIVSALHRSRLHDDEGYHDFIQTDASLNRGNSGGPLLNLQGELVGIASAITSPTGNNIGIGFAVPVEKVRELVGRATKNDERGASGDRS